MVMELLGMKLKQFGCSGAGVPKKVKEAKRYYKLAADQGPTAARR
jgi:TPR repeat protein